MAPLADCSTDGAHIGVGRRTHGQRVGTVIRVCLAPFLPKVGGSFDSLPISSCNDFRRAILPLHGERFSRSPFTEQQGCLPLALVLLAERGQDFGNGILAEGLAEQLDDRACFDRLGLFWIADSDDLETMMLLQTQELKKLCRADQPEFVHDNDAVASSGTVPRVTRLRNTESAARRPRSMPAAARSSL